MELQLILLEYYWWILIKILSRKEKIDIQDIGQMRDSVLAQCKSKDIYLEYCDYLKRRYNASMPTEDILALNWRMWMGWCNKHTWRKFRFIISYNAKIWFKYIIWK